MGVLSLVQDGLAFLVGAACSYCFTVLMPVASKAELEDAAMAAAQLALRKCFVFHCAVAQVALRFMGLKCVNFAAVEMVFASLFLVELLGFDFGFFEQVGVGFSASALGCGTCSCVVKVFDVFGSPLVARPP